MATIAKLAVMLTANIGGFTSNMARATKPLKAFGSSVTSIGSKVLGFGSAIAAVAAGGSMIALVKNSLDSIDALKDQADALGVTTEALSRLNYAASFAGVESEAMGTSLQKMLKNVDDARSGTGTASMAFQALGLDAAKLAQMAPDEAFREIAGAMQGVENPAHRVGLAMDIFGKSGAALLPVLANGKEGLAELAAEADKLGVTITSADAAKIEAANDAMDRMKAAITGAANTLAIQLAPFIEVAADKFTGLATSGDGMTGKIVRGFEMVVSGIAYASDYLSLLKAGFKLLQAGATMNIFAVVKAVDLVGQGLVKLLNLVPGVNVQWTTFTGQLADGLLEEAQQLRDEAGAAFRSFTNGDNAKAVGRFFDDIRAKSAAAAAAAGKTPAKPPIDVEALKEQADKLAKIKDTLADIQKDVTQVGLSDSQKKIADLQGLGATPDQIGQARQLLAVKDQLAKLDKIDTGNALTDFAARMEQLQKLYAQGKVTADQFAAIRDTAKQTLTDKLTDQAKSITDSVRTPLESYQEELDKLNTLLERGLITQETFDRAKLKASSSLASATEQRDAPKLVLAGSAEAQRLAFDSTRGVQRVTRDDIPKKALAEAEEHTKLLERIERNGRPESAEVVEL